MDSKRTSVMRDVGQAAQGPEEDTFGVATHLACGQAVPQFVNEHCGKEDGAIDNGDEADVGASVCVLFTDDHDHDLEDKERGEQHCMHNSGRNGSLNAPVGRGPGSLCATDSKLAGQGCKTLLESCSMLLGHVRTLWRACQFLQSQGSKLLVCLFHSQHGRDFVMGQKCLKGPYRALDRASTVHTVQVDGNAGQGATRDALAPHVLHDFARQDESQRASQHGGCCSL